MINEGRIMGYLTADPKPDYGLVTGRTVVKFAIGSERDFKPGGRKIYDYPVFVAFDRMAEIMIQHLKKGQVVFVEYALQTYPVNYNGQKRSAWGAVVKRIRFDHLRDPVDRPKKGEDTWEEVYYEGFDEEGFFLYGAAPKD